MSRVLLDTSAYSAFMRGDPTVKEMLQTVDAIYVNAVVLGELRAGFLRGRMQPKNEARLRQLLASPRVSAVTIDEETAERYARDTQCIVECGNSDSHERYLDCRVCDAVWAGGDHDRRTLSENPTDFSLAEPSFAVGLVWRLRYSCERAFPQARRQTQRNLIE